MWLKRSCGPTLPIPDLRPVSLRLNWQKAKWRDELLSYQVKHVDCQFWLLSRLLNAFFFFGLDLNRYMVFVLRFLRVAFRQPSFAVQEQKTDLEEAPAFWWAQPSAPAVDNPLVFSFQSAGVPACPPTLHNKTLCFLSPVQDSSSVVLTRWLLPLKAVLRSTCAHVPVLGLAVSVQTLTPGQTLPGLTPQLYFVSCSDDIVSDLTWKIATPTLPSPR